MKNLIVFDLDGTLAQSKLPVDREMARLLTGLLRVTPVAIISGGDWPQFEKQVLSKFGKSASLERLSILPTCGTKFYAYDQSWQKLYSEDFTATEKHKIEGSIAQVVEPSGCKVAKIWGETIEDRGSQITFSALGQNAPLSKKRAWDPKFSKRTKMKTMLEALIPEFSIHMGGMTSVDVTRHGIDKAYGIRKLRDTLGIPISKMLFVGDAIFPGGNDYPAKQAGAESIKVRDPEETKRVIEAVIACVAGSFSDQAGPK